MTLPLDLEEVDRRLSIIMGTFKRCPIDEGMNSKLFWTSYHSDDNAIRLVRAEIRKRGKQREFIAEFHKQEYWALSKPAWECDWDMLDLPTEFQARCALKVLEEAK